MELSTGGRISLSGADNYDSLRGVGLDLVVFDEVADIHPEVWERIIHGVAESDKRPPVKRPTLRATLSCGHEDDYPAGRGSSKSDLSSVPTRKHAK